MDYRNIVLQWGVLKEEIFFEKVCHGTQVCHFKVQCGTLSELGDEKELK